jgi:hypothetical protein
LFAWTQIGLAATTDEKDIPYGNNPSAEKILVTGDLLSYPYPIHPSAKPACQESEDAGQVRCGCDHSGHGPAWRDKDFLNLEAELVETVVSQVGQAVQQGMVTVEEVQKVVNVEPLRVKFTHDDKDLNGKFRRYVNRMVENAYRDARDGKKLEY